MHKRWVKIVLAAVALVVVVVLLVPFFVNADTFRPQLENQLSSALGRSVTFSHLSFSLLTGSLDAEDISIADDPAFSKSPFLGAKKLAIGVEVLPFLFHRDIRITNLTVDSPAIQLIQAVNGKWNFSSIGGASAQPSSQQPTAIPNLTVGELKIKDGSATVSTVPPAAKPFVYSKVNLSVKQFSFATSFPFELSASLPGDGSLKLKGTAGPISQKDAAATPFDATIQLKHFDPVAAGVVDAGKGISMIADFDAQLKSDGTTLSSTGKIKAAKLLLARTGSPAPRPVDVDYTVSNNLDTRSGRVSDLAIHTGSVAVHVTGGFRFTTQAIVLDLHLSAPNLPIDQLEELLPAAGVHLPSGSSLKGGTLTANLAVTGPATAVTIAGPVEIDNTMLAGYDIGSKIQGLNLFKSGGGTQIQTLRTTVSSSPQITQFNDIYGSLPQIGTATGSGTVAPSTALDFKMVATLTSSNAVGAVANQAINQARSFVGGFLHPNAKPAASTANRGIPLTITGTASSPTIHANLVSMLK